MALCMDCVDEDIDDEQAEEGSSYCRRHRLLREQKTQSARGAVSHLLEVKSYCRAEQLLEFDQRTLKQQGVFEGDGICFGLMMAWFEQLAQGGAPPLQCLQSVKLAPGRAVKHQQVRDRVQEEFLGTKGNVTDPVVATLHELGYDGACLSGEGTGLVPIGSEFDEFHMHRLVQCLIEAGISPGNTYCLSLRADMSGGTLHACALYFDERGCYLYDPNRGLFAATFSLALGGRQADQLACCAELVFDLLYEALSSSQDVNTYTSIAAVQCRRAATVAKKKKKGCECVVS